MHRAASLWHAARCIGQSLLPILQGKGSEAEETAAPAPPKAVEAAPTEPPPPPLADRGRQTGNLRLPCWDSPPSPPSPRSSMEVEGFHCSTGSRAWRRLRLQQVQMVSERSARDSIFDQADAPPTAAGKSGCRGQPGSQAEVGGASVLSKTQSLMQAVLSATQPRP